MTKLQTLGKPALPPMRSRTGGDAENLFGCTKIACIIIAFCFGAAIASPAEVTFKTLVQFDGANGAYSPTQNPLSLVQGLDGNFYGITPAGGANINSICGNAGCGTVFRVTAAGKLTTLYNFCSQAGCTDGIFPFGGLIQATDGNLYGTTLAGGAIAYCFGAGCGTVFKITPAGTLTTLHKFRTTDGTRPLELVQGTDGNFYGTTEEGGTSANCVRAGCGTVFKITPAGILTTLYDFCLQAPCTDGVFPQAGLVQATDGNLYGTTGGGGSQGNCGGPGCGTVFKITSAGKLTTLYYFSFVDGAFPAARLVQASDGNFYGTTPYGGNNFTCEGGYGCGTVFKMTAAGKLTTPYDFCFNCADGNFPTGGLVQGTNGIFYGTTSQGGDLSCGPNGGCGTVFSLCVGVRAFVEPLTTSGKVGATVIILGTNLTGATGVSFNNAAAQFTVVSSSQINATVPSGATTGFVTVTTPKGVLKSNKKFRVIP